MKILGIDQSLNHTGLVLINTTEQSNQPITHTIIPSKLKGVERLSYIKKQLTAIIQVWAPIDVIILENYSFGAKGRAVFQIGELGGVIRVILYESGIPWYVAAPMTVKKFASGSGKGDKQLMLKSVFTKWKFDTNDHNLADAFAMAKIGEAILRKDEPTFVLAKYERECINRILQIEEGDENDFI